MRWASSYPFLQVGKLRHKWWGRDLPCLCTRKVTSCAGKWIQSFCVLVHSSIHQALPVYGRKAVNCCCCSGHALLVFADLLRFILPALNFLSDFRCFLFCCPARYFSTWRTVYSPFHLLPPSFPYVTNYSDSILDYQMFCQCHRGVLETLPEQRCSFMWVSNAELHISSGSDQMQVIAVSLELLHFEILSHVFLLPWMLTLEGLGLGSIKNCLGLERSLLLLPPSLSWEESVIWSMWPKCPSGESVWIMGLVHVAIWKLLLIIRKITPNSWWWAQAQGVWSPC